VLFFQLDYDYSLAIFGLKPSGDLVGIAEGLQLAVELRADLTTYRTTLSLFTVLGAK
jgi:hypothetical protein